jgi:SM-20-related protein
MSIINIDAMDNTPLQRAPFKYIVLNDFVPERYLQAINADYPLIDSASNYKLDTLRYGDSFAALIKELQGAELAAHLGEKFDLDLSQSPTTITVRKFCERSDGNIHTDHKSKILTLLLYFNETWENEAGNLRLLRSKNDIEDYAAEIKPIGGTLLAFLRTDESWHGHKRFVGERRMLQLNYLSNSTVAQLNQKVSRMGTHIMKNVLGLR